MNTAFRCAPILSRFFLPLSTGSWSNPGVDPKGLVLIGRSFAGYLDPRAASAEQRLAALVCDPGQVEFMSRIVPSMFDQDDWTRILAADPEMDAVLQRRLEHPRKRERHGARMTTLGAKSLGEFLRL
jgi:hypothetical protein